MYFKDLFKSIQRNINKNFFLGKQNNCVYVMESKVLIGCADIMQCVTNLYKF